MVPSRMEIQSWKLQVIASRERLLYPDHFVVGSCPFSEDNIHRSLFAVRFLLVIFFTPVYSPGVSFGGLW